MNQATLDKIKVASNLLLALLLIAVLITTLLYKQDVKEAMGLKEPDRLVKLYEDTTNLKCICGDPDYGSVVYIPYKK